MCYFRLSNTGRSRTTVVTIDNEGDLAHSCSADIVFLTLGNVDSTSSNSNEEWKHNVEITHGDFNIERDDTTCESTCKKDQLNRKLTLETKEGREISLSCFHSSFELLLVLSTFPRVKKTMSALQECAKSPSLSIVTTVVLDLPVLLNLPLIGTGSLSHILRQYLFIVPHR
jgi:hypothetical protein